MGGAYPEEAEDVAAVDGHRASMPRGRSHDRASAHARARKRLRREARRRSLAIAIEPPRVGRACAGRACAVAGATIRRSRTRCSGRRRSRASPGMGASGRSTAAGPRDRPGEREVAEVVIEAWSGYGATWGRQGQRRRTRRDV